MRFSIAVLVVVVAAALSQAQEPGRLDLPDNTWVKLSPLAETPPSPRLGYEGACVWDSHRHAIIRYGGHNQGGGGEQNAEVWTFDPLSARWTLMQPNTSPPGICCGQQNLFDPLTGRYLRFPAFSGSHGWQWFRGIYLNDSSLWTYDLLTNTWRNMRPLPTAHPRPLRCASWDSEFQVAVVFGGEGSNEGTLVYDPYTNTWMQMNPQPQPAFRSGGNMAYDAARKVHVLFGAQTIDDPHTWTYDLRNNKWLDRKPAGLPPTDGNDAVLTYDAVNRVVIALVKVTTGEGETATSHLETWAYDAGENTWTKMNPPQEPDPSGNRARQLMFAPELNVVFLENRTHPPRRPHEQQIWAYRFARQMPDPDAPPLPPTKLRVTTAATGATLTWEASPSAVAAYTVYRGTGTYPWQVDYQPLATVGADQRTYRDERIEQGTIYFYALRSIDAQERQGPRSIAVRTQPPVVEDLVVSVTSPTRVALRWNPLQADTIVGYHVERAPVEVYTEDQLVRLKSHTMPLPEPSVGAIKSIGAFTRITREPLDEPSMTDTSIDLTNVQQPDDEPIYARRFSDEYVDAGGRPYRFAVYGYRVRAVNALGVESGPSAVCYTIPSAPQFVFAKENGTTCDLKWQANPEQAIRGYRVYRMDGRFAGAAIPRLTPDPFTALSYQDDGAGEVTRRYYVVAVDALGQEGLPSAPVWFRREWQPFYEPFVGEWHQ